MTLDLAELAGAAGVAQGIPSRLVSGFSSDTRTIQAGDLFFAIRGAAYDGHDYVAQAFERGASAAVVERDVEARGLILRVSNTIAALQAMACWARRRWGGGQVVGVTGSAGKTTTKEAIAHLLATAFSVGKNEGNLNNHIGLPLSVLRLPSEAKVAVIELGMNHAGEIRELARVAAPDVGVVSNVGYAHIENFDSIDGIARAKRELIESLPASGVAVLNADDPRVLAFREVHPGRAILFGLGAQAELRAERVAYRGGGSRFEVCGTCFETSLPGRHGVLNVLAALAVARHFSLAFERLTGAVRELRPPKMRGEKYCHAGITIFNDCYNANPEAVRSMLDVLRATPARRRIAVLGEMLELGRWGPDLHRDLGRYAAGGGIDVVIGVRGAAAWLVQEARNAGLPPGSAHFFDDPVEAGEFVRQMAREGDVVLFKGSRGTRVEKALERLLS